MREAMKAQVQREIPYNYTSAEDEQVVRILFGAPVWDALERLRARRVTGRSARLLMRFIGDMFILRRNPFIYQEMVDSASSRRQFLLAFQNDLRILSKNAGGDEDVIMVLDQCQKYLDRLMAEIASASGRRAHIRRVLGAVIGEENVLFDPFSLVSHATDGTDWRLFLPLAVVFPTEEAHVAPLLVAIEKLGLKAIPRGAGTGLTGGAIPVAEDCVMINLEKLNRIRGFGEKAFTLPDGSTARARTLEVEAGVVTEDAIQAAAKEGWVFATDPTSAWASTIGGNLAENAGGKTAVLWGTAIDNVLSFRMSLPGGKTVLVKRMKHPLRKILHSDKVAFQVRGGGGDPKSASRTIELSGLDIRRKDVWKDITNKALGGLPGLQKEGTDGVITSARFVLYPAFEHLRTACLEFFGESMDEAGKVILDLSREFVNKGRETLMALEHFDEEYVRAIGYKVKASRGDRPKAVLLIDIVAHTPEDLAKGEKRLLDLVARYPNTEIFLAKDAQEGVKFWADRKRLGAIAKHTNAFKLNEDIVLPLEALAGFASYIDQYNINEERYNQARFAEEVLAYLDMAGEVEEAEALAAKAATARKLCQKAQAAVQAADKASLREGKPAADLLKSLLSLFQGYAGACKMLEKLHKDVRARLIVIATHMHAGDGNVHVNIPTFSNDQEMLKRAFETADTVMRHVVTLGGVVSGEHGIGVTKLKHLEKERLEALAAYRQVVDPQGVMNPGKLSDLSVPDKVFTPSFNLLELEARILQNDSLFELADKISKCVRCGRCKPDCCVFHPGKTMFFHPRNKNLAIAAVIEALLYDAQRAHSTRFEFLRELEEIADHCTICHKCLKPCPVDIDTGEISILERRILAARKYKHTALATRMSLGYLKSRSRAYNALFRIVVLRWGLFFQRLGAKGLAFLPNLNGWKGIWPFNMLRTPIPSASPGTLHSILPLVEDHQALILSPKGEALKTVFYFPGCGSERLFSDVGKASLYLLLKSGAKVVLPPPFLCCGFPINVNAQVADNNRRVLSDTIIFSQIKEMLRHLKFDACVVSCGTCKEALHGMGLEDIFSAPLEDISRFAVTNGLKMEPGGDYLYHRPCHDSMNETAVGFFAKNAGMKLKHVPHCCSEAGTLAMSRPDIAFNMLDRKTVAVKEALEGRENDEASRAELMSSLSPAYAKASAGIHSQVGEIHRSLPAFPTGVARGNRAKADGVILTNCPSCLQGLGRNAVLGVKPRHMAVELALRAGGKQWEKELKEFLKAAEVVNF
jgi:FAD/FMN-containing dehydrogenase/Fe-S oxidoreductase